MKPAVVAVLSAVAVLTAGCGEIASTDDRPPVFSPSLPTPPQRPPAYLGDTLELDRIGDSRIAVTISQVINPASVPYGGEADKNYVAVELTVKNIGALTITGDANNDVSVVGSDEQDYASALATVSQCKNFLYGQFVLAPQASATGCVSFALPVGVSPAKIKYSPSSGISVDVGVWSL
ncbi:DUF4352 domain-containing protein [Mycolicibacillus trivialis]|uniref:DUF4352 domain-containing protein n=1 Tax=Mycolicibacillus trivialis TaxID=1798 RepID=UPI000A166151|nr:DUF4352 domain-containing protein [Mycolicibacillus trivialis]